MTRPPLTTEPFKDLSVREASARVLPVLAGILAALIPFPKMTAVSETCFYGALLAVAWRICRGVPFLFKSPLTVPFAVFVAWCSIGVWFSLDRANSVTDLYAHLIKYIVLYYLWVNLFDSEKGLGVLSRILIASAGVFSVAAVVSFYVFSGHHLSDRLGEPAVLGITSDYIGFFALAAILLSPGLFQGRMSVMGKAFLAVCVLCIFAATVLTQSRATLIAALVSTLVLLGARRKAWIVSGLALFVIAILFTPLGDRFSVEQFKRNERVGLYWTTLEVIKSYPWTGIGFGMQIYGNEKLLDLNRYNNRIPEPHRQQTPIRSPHSTFLDVTVRTGLIGLLFFLSILSTYIRMGWNVVRHARSESIQTWGLCLFAVFLSILVQGMFSDGMFGPQAMSLYMNFAMMTILWRVHAGPKPGFDQQALR